MALLQIAVLICVYLPTGLLFGVSAYLFLLDCRRLRSEGLSLPQSLLQSNRAQLDVNTEESGLLDQPIRSVKVVKFTTARQARKVRSRNLSRK